MKKRIRIKCQKGIVFSIRDSNSQRSARNHNNYNIDCFLKIKPPQRRFSRKSKKHYVMQYTPKWKL